MGPAQMRRTSVGEGEQEAHQQRTHAELSGPHPEREERLEARGHRGRIDNGFETGQGTAAASRRSAQHKDRVWF